MMKFRLIVLINFLLISICSAQKIDTLAEKMLIYQLPNGAWSKSIDKKNAINYKLKIDEALINLAKSRDNNYATIDNHATSKEIFHLVKAYATTENINYLKSAEKGIEYLLSMQYKNGGFPQYYPNTALYRKQITYNDNAMINALMVLHKTAEGIDGFNKINTTLQKKAKIAVEKGIQCILKTQYIQNGKPSIWADQYNEITLVPEKARAFEPASLASSESVEIIEFLMLQKITPTIENAIRNAINWLENNKIKDYNYSIINENGKLVRRLFQEKNAVIWSRFYDLENSKPIFGDRDGSTTYIYEEISLERKNGYNWFITSPEKLINKTYPDWLKKNNIKK